MSFDAVLDKYEGFDFSGSFNAAGGQDVMRALSTKRCSSEDLLALLSPAAEGYLEDIAKKARQVTLKNFGKAIQLYTPLYLSDYCENRCLYCGFNVDNKIERRKLGPEELEKEAAFIAATGLRHILILTGSSRRHSPVSYIRDCVRILKRYFTSISIETYAMISDEYAELIKEGVDGLTIYQEVYNRDIYDKVHAAGTKKDYIFRLEAPERAAEAGMRFINIGALLGLYEWRSEIFFTGLHAQYLQDKFSDAEVSVSVPRLRSHVGEFRPYCDISDTDVTQGILALRLFLPRAGITLSTRESAYFREHALLFGITKMSAGSTTAVGGHTLHNTESGTSVQFEISDKRGVAEIREMLSSKGYQPVLKDWQPI